MKRLSFASELHSLHMSEKELYFQPLHWWAWLSVKRRMVLTLLCFLGVMCATPLGLKWLLVQQLQHVLKREVSVQAVQLHPMSLSIDVQGLSIQNTQGGELAGWQRLTVDVSAQSFAQRALVLDALTLHGPRVSVVHLGQGRFDFSDLLDGPTTSNDIALPPFVLHEVSIHNGRITLEDRPHQRTHSIENFNLTLPRVSSLAGHNGLTMRPELSATFNGAPVHLGGTVRPLADTPEGALALTVDAFDLASLQAYVPNTLPLHLASGKLSADLKLQLATLDGRTALLLNGTARVQDVSMYDARDRALASFKTLALSLSQSDVLARSLVFSDVMLDAPNVSVRMDAAGELNWLAAMPPTQAEPTHPQSPAFALQVNRFRLHGGLVDFADASVKPAVQARITDVNAVLNSFSTQPNSTADVKLNGNLGVAAPLAVQARLQPLAVTSFLDAKLNVKSLELTRISGYAQKYLGYALDKGKLSMDASYRIKNKQLQADTHVFIDQLTLGEQVPSAHAVDAPVSLGVSLLKNSSGQIDIDLPMSGTVDAPDFSFGGLIAQTIGNLLVKVVTAPVRAIGSLASGDEKTD
jgi:hypothetical protein